MCRMDHWSTMDATGGPQTQVLLIVMLHQTTTQVELVPQLQFIVSALARLLTYPSASTLSVRFVIRAMTATVLAITVAARLTLTLLTACFAS